MVSLLKLGISDSYTCTLTPQTSKNLLSQSEIAQLWYTHMFGSNVVIKFGSNVTKGSLEVIV